MIINRHGRETAGEGWWRMLRAEARRMRSEPTAAEEALWRAIRGHRLGLRFRRQHVIDRFIVDFVCLPAKLIVEVDGGIHEKQVRRDEERDARLQGAGYLILRYTNNNVLGEIDRVVDDIRRHLAARIDNLSPPGER